jgi:hypothetical protein
MERTAVYTKALGREISNTSKRDKTYHIISRGNKWAVVRNLALRPLKIFSSKQSAINFARTRVNYDDTEIVVHTRDGEVKE